MACAAQDYVIKKGETFQSVVRWETTPIVYKAITGITNAAPAVITAASHGVPDGWRVAVSSVQGMKEINALSTPPRGSDYHQATVQSASTIALNDVNAADFGTYTTGGVLQYNTPVSLTGFTARMTIRNRVGGSEIVSLTTENGGITLDDAAYTITLLISATATTAFTATHGVYDLELVSGAGVVTRILSGKVSFKSEVTT